ncbi:D-alanyl-D-alanine carboxypeptidase family protein [Paraclostridium bifermentans]|uniref:D-alanyl-D-alanine carboxypeptidase family protein n=1 Tax=Paraclostridium bifermentans TaxID=1490 RepID=UPI00038C9FCD|nr:D-alanyl-D-alanine carboxypeptidase family protein [Paraclostridium bifermentans]EQK46380.1 D-alanyl-D-alanine carboxypeptidase family protein [[Clostridium] bifermentans ATCC 19299] [Paraclostridium bifermentans ATCC 19299]MCE9675881.1 D-alanyl-D-alanine carboxypeptidase [Paraclostridium bifermentans]TQO58940.1 D-alanyl-D-alanine carboxypeptidase [Paraclostridium bifermentans]GKZ01803.1 D-alanyl-D-alanine carboxypeptidase [Paraclostridium bifermentans]GKZ08142.1 D-alanyl-D-alanine carboxyp
MTLGVKKIISFMLILAFVTPYTIFATEKEKEVDKYSLSSILIDQDTNRVLYAKNPDEKRPLASLSKMMTFLIAIEAIENKKVSPKDKIKITKKIASVKGSSYHLKENEEVELIELMKGLMIVSGNDAAIAIATHIGKSPEQFVKIMNKKAKDIGMSNTHFVNPHGLPIYDLQNPKAQPKQNISTARDIATLGKYMFDNYEKQVTSVTDMVTYSNPNRGFEKNNTNPLLRIIPDVDGIKTGYTGNAGYCLSFSMNVKKQNDIRKYRVIGVSLGANHKNKRLSASLDMLNYGKENYHTEKVIRKNDLIGKKYIKGLEELEVELRTKDELYTILGNEENLNTQLTLKELEYPIKKGDVLGVIKYYTDNGEILGSIDIVSAKDVDDASLITKIKMLFSK